MEQIKSFLEIAKIARKQVHQNLTFESRTVSGAALGDGERILCLSAFRKEKKSGSPGVGFQRFSHRRSRR